MLYNSNICVKNAQQKRNANKIQLILRLLNYIKITEKQKEVTSKSYTITFKYLVKKCCQNKKQSFNDQII